MNIIIPLGGLGERFKKEGFIQPKPLIPILGKPMLYHVIDNLILNNEDNLIIIYNNVLDKNRFCELIKHNYDNIMLINIKIQTEGAIETILYGLNYLKKNNPILLDNKCMLIDGDTIYNIDILNIFRNQKNNAIFGFIDNNEDPIYSYTKVDEYNNIIDIKEKCKISNIANTGCYCFENSSILKQYCEKIIRENIREKNEFYTSCLIKEMLKDNLLFQANIIDKTGFDCVGTPFQLKMYSISNANKHITKKRFCFDLDNTLVTFPTIKNDYTSVKPIYKNIEILQKLKNIGHTIIIYTARRMKTFNGNVGQIIQNVGKITLDTLDKYNIPYDEIYFGKPYADYYIDDLAINANENLEQSLGIYNECIKERSFNKIEIINNIYIQKTTTIKNSLDGEIYFYNNIPININNYFPKLIDTFENDSYIIEKIKGITFSKYFISEILDEFLLLKLLNHIKNIHVSNLTSAPTHDINIYLNYYEKIKYRFENFDYSIFKDYEIIYQNIIKFVKDYEQNNQGIFGIIHGDPVFSNIIITETNNLKFIDMRGKLGNQLTIYGDIFYDYSKIYQSLIGYDEILLNQIVSNKYRTNLIKVFNKFIIMNFDKEKLQNIKMITNSLLFSLIPLHNNSKIYDYFNLIALDLE